MIARALSGFSCPKNLDMEHFPEYFNTVSDGIRVREWPGRWISFIN